MEYSIEDTELEESSHYKVQWDKNGILKHWEMTYTIEGKRTGLIIKASGFTIPSFPMEVFMVIFAISTVGIVILNKKRKNY